MTTSTNKSGRILKYVVLIVVVVNLAIVAVVFLGANSPQPHPMPNPNGYNDFVKAGQMLVEKPGDYDKMSKEELAALVATNQEALKLVRVGLGRECRVPDNYSPDYFNHVITSPPSQLSLFKATGQSHHGRRQAGGAGREQQQGGEILRRGDAVQPEIQPRRGYHIRADPHRL